MENKKEKNKKLLKIFIYISIFALFLFLTRYILDKYLYDKNNMYNLKTDIYEYNVKSEVDIVEKDIIIYDEKQNEVKITSNNKLVVINLWAIWCQYCKEELPIFDELEKEYSKDIKLYMVCSVMDKSEIEDVVKYVKEKGYNFKLYFDLDSNLVSRYNVLGFPTTVFLDKDLNTLAKNVGALKKENIIDNIKKYK